MTQVLRSTLGAHLASLSNVLCRVLFDGMGPNNGIIVRLRAKPSLGVFLSPPSPANRSRLCLPQHPGAGRQAPSTRRGLTRPFLLPDSRHCARGDVSRVTPARGKGCFPCPGCTTVTVGLHCALPSRERAEQGRGKELPGREERQMSRHCAAVPTFMPATCRPGTRWDLPGITWRQGVRWDLPGAKGMAISPCTAAPGGMDQPHPRREKPNTLHYALAAPNNPLSKALIPWQTRVECRTPELSAASPSTT